MHDLPSGHDAYGPFHVAITSAKSPITAGLQPFDTTDELYFKQVGDQPITPLAIAHSKTTGQDEPMAWAYAYGKGRVFQTVLGHDATCRSQRERPDPARRGLGGPPRPDLVRPAGFAHRQRAVPQRQRLDSRAVAEASARTAGAAGERGAAGGREVRQGAERPRRRRVRAGPRRLSQAAAHGGVLGETAFQNQLQHPRRQ